MSVPVLRVPQRRMEQGVALIIVLWIIMLLSITVGSFALIARIENFQARHLFDGAQARYAAEAGLHRAVYELRNPDPLTRWVADGRPYEVEFEGARLTIELMDESGKVDLNAADELMLAALFDSLGMTEDERNRLVDVIMDWRDPDDLIRPFGAEDDDYESAGYPYGAKDGFFDTVGELQQVLGMDYALFRRLEPALTLYSGRNQVNAAFAPFEVLRALPGMNDELARQFIELRQQLDPSLGQQLTLPDGTPVVAEGGGLTYTVRSRAELPNGAWTVLDATIRLGGVTQGRAFRVVRWRDSESS